MARVKQLADKDGELIYPVVDPTQLHFSGTDKQAVKGDGTIGIPQYVKQLEGNGHITSADIAHQYDNNQVHQRLDIASSSMTTGKPVGDGFINTYSWDNTDSYDTQVYIPNGETINNGMPQIRFKNNADGWSSWKNIITSNSMPSPSPTIITDFGNISTDTTKTMSADGFITGKAITFASGEQAWIELDGIMVGGIPYSSFGGNIQVAFCVPVKKNSTVRFVKNGTAMFQKIRLQGYRY